MKKITVIPQKYTRRDGREIDVYAIHYGDLLAQNINLNMQEVEHRVRLLGGWLDPIGPSIILRHEEDVHHIVAFLEEAVRKAKIKFFDDDEKYTPKDIMRILSVSRTTVWKMLKDHQEWLIRMPHVNTFWVMGRDLNSLIYYKKREKVEK